MSGHTLGPWSVGTTVEGERLCIVGDVDSVVCDFDGRSGGSLDADARLIAAAPELLAALQWYVENDDTNIGQWGNEYFEDGLHRAEAVIAKATGENA